MDTRSTATWSSLLLCVAGCATAPVTPPAGVSTTPSAGNVVQKNAPAAPVASSPAPNADACGPLRRFAAPTAGSTSSVGIALLGALGASLSTAPEKPPHQRLGGGPAIVVDTAQLSGKDWYRVVAADGSLGWITGKFVSAPAAAIFRDKGGELSDRVVAANADATDVQVQLVPEGAAAQILSASDAAYPEQMSQLGSGDYLGSDWLPWLRVRAGKLEGWLAPSKTELVWWPGERACTLYAGFEGIARQAFLANAQSDLATRAPKSGDSVRHVVEDSVEPWPDGAACKAGGAVFAPNNGGPRVILFECTHPTHGKSQVLAFVEAERRSYFVMDEESRTRIVRYRAADVAGDTAPELVLELGLQSSHQYDSLLLVASSHPAARELAVLPLDGDDTIGTWSVDEPARSITLARASQAGLVVHRTEPLGPGLIEKPAYSAIGTMHSDLLEAERDVLATPGAQLLPLDYPTKSWASGGIFGTQAAACQSLDQRVVSPQARATKQDRVCGAPRAKSKVH